MSEKFNKQFDKIWCLSCADKERLDKVTQEFKKNSLDVTFFFNPQNPIIKSCCKLYYETKDYLKLAETQGYNKVFSGVAACFIGHYDIIKTSYDLGYEKILIMEDDIQFIDNLDFDNIAEQTPNDWDILQFYDVCRYAVNYDGSCKKDDNFKETISIYNGEKDFWRKKENDAVCRSNVMYALSRKAMKNFLDYYETHKPTVADFQFDFYDTKKFNFYVNDYTIIKRASHASKIRNDNYFD